MSYYLHLSCNSHRLNRIIEEAIYEAKDKQKKSYDLDSIGLVYARVDRKEVM